MKVTICYKFHSSTHPKNAPTNSYQVELEATNAIFFLNFLPNLIHLCFLSKKKFPLFPFSPKKTRKEQISKRPKVNSKIEIEQHFWNFKNIG